MTQDLNGHNLLGRNRCIITCLDNLIVEGIATTQRAYQVSVCTRFESLRPPRLNLAKVWWRCQWQMRTEFNRYALFLRSRFELICFAPHYHRGNRNRGG